MGEQMNYLLRGVGDDIKPYLGMSEADLKRQIADFERYCKSHPEDEWHPRQIYILQRQLRIYKQM